MRLILVGFGYGSVDAKPKTDIIRRPIGRDWKAGEVCGFSFHGLRAGFAKRKTSRNRHFLLKSLTEGLGLTVESLQFGGVPMCGTFVLRV